MFKDMNSIKIAVFLICYSGMLLGRLPKLRLDRTGIALLAAIILIASGSIGKEEALSAIHIPTITLLFGMMVISAQLRLGGFYSRFVELIGEANIAPWALLLLLVLGSGVLSAIFSNDIVCLAAAPVLVYACNRRGVTSVPFLLALACASNVGSVMTLIGNPQNMLIGQTLGLSFSEYLGDTWTLTLLGLVAVWAIIVMQNRGRWFVERSGGTEEFAKNVLPHFNGWETGKGLAISVILIVVFIGGWWPRELCALSGAAILLTSRKFWSRDMLELVDWQLLVLFVSLFVVNSAFQSTGLMERLVDTSLGAGVSLRHPASLFCVTVILSNAVSNVPAVMLVLPWATYPGAGTLLAVASTLAGNLLLVGSIANIIVSEQASSCGVKIDWRIHARTGIPVTIATLAIAAFALWIK